MPDSTIFLRLPRHDICTPRLAAAADFASHFIAPAHLFRRRPAAAVFLRLFYRDCRQRQATTR